MKRISIGVLGIIALTTSSVQATPEQQVQAVVSHLVGIMDTSAQARSNPKAPNVRMTTCQATVQNDSNNIPSVFLYQEQALSDRLSQPYRQRFLQISLNSNNIVQSSSFKPSNSTTLIGLCNKPLPERIVSDIGTPVCSVSIKPVGQDYIGETPPQGCPANVRGAVRITNRIILHSTGMDTLDRGFDASGNQVWGATNETYQFRWIQPRN